MIKRKNPKKPADLTILEIRSELLKEDREIRNRLDYMSNHLDKLWEHVSTTNERLQDLEIYANVMSRLMTILCIEKMGIKLNDLKKLLKRIEKETVDDSQINYLEELYKLDRVKRHNPDQSESRKEEN